ncbi:MAG: SIR2 family NAD-dependent protein deacylase [Candidatus Heimdallarchaeota archaeon]
MNNLSLEEKIELVAEWIAKSKHLVAFTGAGISTQSGIPDFRGPDGVWTRRDKGLSPPKMKKAWSEITPNEGHLVLVELQKMGLLKFLITQNTDNLHRRSGIHPDTISELHGNGTLLKCLSCDERMTYEEAGWNKNILGPGYLTQPTKTTQPNCPHCQGRLISSVINFGDPMPEYDFKIAYEHSEKSDVYLMIGSSLVVNPAADLPILAMDNDAKTVLINIGETPLDGQVDIKIEEKIGGILTQILSKVKAKLS